MDETNFNAKTQRGKDAKRKEPGSTVFPACFFALSRSHLTSVLSVLVLLCGLSFGAIKPVLNRTKAPEFELKDQYNRSFSYRFPRQNVTVLAFGDRSGAEQIEGWVRPLWDRYHGRIDQQGVAVLSTVPSFARGFVRRIFKTKVKYSVLLDWNGAASRAYNYQSGKANLYVIDREGQIVMKVFGTVNQSDLNRVFAEIDRML